MVGVREGEAVETRSLKLEKCAYGVGLSKKMVGIGTLELR
jgi:hypothetical protein